MVVEAKPLSFRTDISRSLSLSLPRGNYLNLTQLIDTVLNHQSTVSGKIIRIIQIIHPFPYKDPLQTDIAIFLFLLL